MLNIPYPHLHRQQNQYDAEAPFILLATNLFQLHLVTYPLPESTSCIVRSTPVFNIGLKGRNEPPSKGGLGTGLEVPGSP